MTTSSSSSTRLSSALLSPSPAPRIRSVASQLRPSSITETRRPPRRVQIARARRLVRRKRSLVEDVAADDAVGELRVPTSVPVRVAHELLLAGHRYLDVRTEDEFSVGHAEGAVNVPYMVKFGSGMIKNPYFVAHVSQVFCKDAEIIVGCESGRISLTAATELMRAGFTGITDIAGGYTAWMQNGMPMD